MKRKNPVSLEEARRSGDLKHFIAEQQEQAGIADRDRFDALMHAMAKTTQEGAGTKPKRKKRRAY